jgi:hypothetical protein
MKIIYMSETIALMFRENQEKTMNFLKTCEIKQVKERQYAVKL